MAHIAIISFLNDADVRTSANFHNFGPVDLVLSLYEWNCLMARLINREPTLPQMPYGQRKTLYSANDKGNSLRDSRSEDGNGLDRTERVGRPTTRQGARRLG